MKRCLKILLFGATLVAVYLTADERAWRRHAVGYTRLFDENLDLRAKLANTETVLAPESQG